MALRREELARRRAGLAARRAAMPAALRERLEGILARAENSDDDLRVIPRRPSTESAPLSFSQQRLWFLDRLEPGSTAYNLPAAFRVSGRLDVEVLRRTLDEVVRRHEVLRTTFTEIDGEPRQVVMPAAAAALLVIDLETLPTPVREARCRELLDCELRQPFDLARGPLVRFALVRLGPAEHVLAVTFHHVVADGWSIQVFLREAGTLYAALGRGEPSPLPELPIQYGDYAAWERRMLDDERLASRLDHWRERLAGAPPLLELPLDRPRPAVASLRGAIRRGVVGEELTEHLRTLADDRRVTLFVLLVAAFQLLLARYSGDHDVVVGTPVSGRRWVETEGLIGFFVNSLVLRSRLGGAATLAEVIDRVGEVVVDVQSHQDLPFEQLVEALRVERSLSHAPLFQVMVAFQNVPRAVIESAELALEEIEVDPGVEKFDLTLAISEERDRLVLALGYASDLFDPETVDRLLDDWRRVLAAMVADPTRSPWTLPLLDEAERAQLLAESQAAASYPLGAASLVERFERIAAERPEAVAACCEDEAITYGELDRRANRLAHHLRSLGVGPEVLVGVLMERSLDLVMALVGVLKSGGAYLPLDPAHPPERLAYVVADARAPVVLAHRDLADRLPAAGRVVDLAALAETLADEREDRPVPCLDPDHAAYVIYTSGSTGRPKGVVNTHANVLRLLAAADELFAFGADDVWTLFHSPAFDFSVWELWGALAHGGRLVVVPRWDSRSPESFLALLRREGVTVLNQTPSAFAQLVEADAAVGGADLPALREVIFGGEALDIAGLAGWLLRHPERPRLVNMYGITETTVHVTFHPVAAGEAAGGRSGQGSPIGRPLGDLTARVLDRQGQPVPPGVPGELLVGGAGLARGYRGRPALTAERFVPDPFSHRPGGRLYRSGDLVRRCRQGGLEYLGRIDQQVKIRGHRIELGEIEAALRQCPGVRDAVVTVREQAPLGRHLAAYVVPADDRAATPEPLRERLRETLPDYMLPAAWAWLPALPLTANGKVDRRALPEPAAVGRAGAAARGRTRTQLEGVLAAVWSSVLGVDQVAHEDDFFDLGGHSLLAVQVVARLRADLAVELPVRALFETSSLAELAARVEGLLRERQGLSLPPIVRRPEGDALPLSSAQQRLWFLDQLEPASSRYNIPARVDLELDLDVAALGCALREIVRRHEVLRTHFVNLKGQPRQVVDPPPDVPLRVVDLAAIDARQRERAAGAVARREALTPFELSRGPLIRFVLLRLAARSQRLLITVHHIASDGWSMGLLLRELEALYGAFSQGRPSPLPELDLQYGDYARWQIDWLQGEALARRLHYWSEQLAGAQMVLDLPTDRPRPSRLQARGASVGFELPAALTAEVRDLSRRERATPFMVLIAAYHALLGRITGQDDVLVGTPAAGRDSLALESLIGLFVNMVAIRGRLREAASFRDLLRQVRETSLGAYSHQDLPFDKLVEVLRPARSSGRNPLFQVILSYQEAVPQTIELPGATVVSGSPGSAETKFDLEAYFWEGEERITGRLVYGPELFDRTTVRRLAARFRRLLELAVTEPDRPLAELQLLTPAERQQILVEWNDTAQPAPAESTVHELFERRAAERPDAVALETAGRQLTYAALDRRADRVAARLRRLGVAPETCVGVLLDRSIEAVVALLAIVKAGGAYLPLNLGDPAHRTRTLLDDAGVSVLLTTAEVAAVLPEHGMTVILLEASEAIDEADETASDVALPPARRPGADDVVYRMYTSGSTGTPKGVAITHRNVLRLVTGARYARLDPGQVFFQLAPLSFDAATFEIWGCLLNGGRLVVHSGPLPTLTDLRREIGRYGITTLWLTAGLFHQLVAGPLDGLEQVEQLLAGGEALSRAHAEELFEKLPSCRLINGYGPTETTTFACCHPVERGRPGETIPIGRPISNTRVYVLNRAMRPVALGERGELFIAGDGVGRGYHGRPRWTAASFVPDPFAERPGGRLYRTGDLVRLRRGGEVEFLGRGDHQVKVRGFRIELGEIEAALADHPEVGQAVVVVREEKPGDKRLIAYVGAAGQPPPSSGALKEYLEERLPDYMVPGMWVVLDALPLTRNGKIDRASLPAPSRALVTAGRALVPSKDDLQQRLVEIWEKVLGIDTIGITDDFFELGGHSLLIVQLIARIEETFGKRVPMAELLQGATVERLASLLRQDTVGPSWSAVVPMQESGTQPPLFFVHPAGGNLFCYTDLVRGLGPEQPFYGLQARADAAGPAGGGIEAMAAEYLQAIRSARPDGPYHIGGWSMGGVIAFEMARQLERSGTAPALLAILDAEAPTDQPAVYTWVVLLGSFALDLGLPLEQLRQDWDEVAALPPMGQLRRISEAAKKAGLVPADMNLAQFRKLFDSFKRNAQTMRSYAGGPYGGRIVLFRAEEPLAYIGKELPTNYYANLEKDSDSEGVDPRDPAKGWGRWAKGGVDVRLVPGNHYTMVREPHVRLLVEQLRACVAGTTKER